MDEVSRQWYLKCFEVEFLRSKAMEFQALFTRIMEQAHTHDFTQVRPWGNIGDQKCDGWLASEKRLFQVYAPNELTKAETEQKMDDDFMGAVTHWKNQFDHWTFVHNSRDGVPPFVLQKTLAYTEAYPAIGFVPWGYVELAEQVKSLQQDQLIPLFGFAPSSSAMRSVRFEDIEQILQHIMADEAPAVADLRPVPQDKLEANKFSDDVQNFLVLGMRKSHLVGDFFKKHSNPRYGDALAYQFSKKYIAFKQTGLNSDEIFWELRGFAGANDANSDKEQAAALALLAHFFEECDIFERPIPQGGQA
jgi:hypothetical protein